jgi:hypothetical protein
MQSPYIDVIEKTGNPLYRVDMQKLLSEHGLSFVKVSRIKFPKLAWSDRRIETME